MGALSISTWTMDVSLNRKRSRLTLGDDDDGEEERRQPEPSPSLSTFSDASLKRSRTQGDLDELDIIRPKDAWSVDVDGILASTTLKTPPGSSLQAHDNASNYRKGSSILVLCVQGSIELHYDILCSALPELYKMSPSLQALVLCRDPTIHTPSTNATFSLPLIQAVSPSYNHFVRLGLLHPLGGGECPLDALVVVDTKARRRLVLPFGWGAGKHAGTPAGGMVQAQLTELLKNCVQALAKEF
ncbi:hypothetical protein P280DRAFT_120146 [Massarina eburnea CBS 473.64]|uniref:Uncharacterized protein n=1 Tax=Massarina eburnea CBS 473.64 TaxID=1395130 RepID=A0A6A6SC56_9PLEO|nr:hypothetical protein P280DRAFT_120146 [Massarina eburnea CBS 473.64]